MREAGQITFGMVQKALIKATSEGGRFYGALQKANATFTGQWNSLIEGVQTLGRMIGEAVLPRMTEMVSKANEILQVFIALPNKVEFLGNVFIAAVDVALATTSLRGCPPKGTLEFGAGETTPGVVNDACGVRDGVALQQHHIPPRLALHRPQRGPQPGNARSNDEEVNTLFNDHGVW